MTGSQGQQVSYSIQRIESLSDLQTALGVNVDANATYGMFSGSAKVDFANNSTFHDYSIFLLVQVQVTNSFRRILTPALTPQAQQMITQGNFAQFFNDFGDTFISGMSTGGEYIVVLEVHTYSESDQQNLTARPNASGGLGAFSGSLSAQFSNSINSMGQSHSLQFHSFQEGGDTSQVTDADQIVAKGNAFPLHCRQSVCSILSAAAGLRCSRHSTAQRDRTCQPASEPRKHVGSTQSALTATRQHTIRPRLPRRIRAANRRAGP